MLKKTHAMTGQAIGTLVAVSGHWSPTQALPVLLGLYAGTVLPDIDQPHASANQTAGALGDLIAKGGHRNLTHSIWALLLVNLPWYLTIHLLPKTPLTYGLFLWGLGLGAGYALHLIEDNLSRQGILWWYPLTHYETTASGHPYKKRRYHRWRYRTGGPAERIIWRLAEGTWLVAICQLWYQWQQTRWPL